MSISHTRQVTAIPEPRKGKALETSSVEKECLRTQMAQRAEHLIIPEEKEWISRWKKFKLTMSGTSPDGRGGLQSMK